MKFDLIILDYDGVVADSEVLNNRLMSEVLSRAGMPTSLDEALSLYMGKRWLDCRPLIEARFARPCLDHVLAEWTVLCQESAADALQPVPGVVEFIRGRERRCIASSSPPDWIELGLARFDLVDHSGPIFSAAVHVSRGKPYPDLFLHAASAAGVDPERCLVIEDSPFGVQAGVSAGMTVVGLCAGGHIRPGHADRLSQAGAHHIATDFSAVADLLDGARALSLRGSP